MLGIVEFSVITFTLFYLQGIKVTKNTLLITSLVWIIVLLSFVNLKHWIAIIILFSIIIIIFYKRFFRTCIDLTIIIFMGMISDHLSQVILGEGVSIYIHLIVFVAIYALLFSFLVFIVKKFKKILDNRKYSFMTKWIIAMLASVTVIVLYLNIFIPTTYDEIRLAKINLIIQVSYLLIFFILSMLLIKTYKGESRLKFTKMQQELHNQYVDSLESVNKDMQKFRHDYLNILTTMGGYIANKDMEQLELYFKSKIIKAEQDTLAKSDIMKKVSNLEVVELKGLILTKLFLAVDKDITVEIDIPEKIDAIPVDIIDFSRVLGIFIDNAIEASENTNERFIKIIMHHTSPNNISCVIENSFSEKVDVNEIYESRYSTKVGDRGYGLSNVKEIVSKYPNLILETLIEDDLFIQEIELITKS